MQGKPFVKLGRGHESDVRISDISVSRFHATLRYSGSAFYIEDNGSKFGTLVQVKRPMSLETSPKLKIQAGRTTLKMYVKVPWSFLPSCFRSEVSSFDPFNLDTAN